MADYLSADFMDPVLWIRGNWLGYVAYLVESDGHECVVERKLRGARQRGAALRGSRRAGLCDDITLSEPDAGDHLPHVMSDTTS